MNSMSAFKEYVVRKLQFAQRQLPLLFVACLSSLAQMLQAATPVISAIPDQSTSQGSTYSYTPSLGSSGSAGSIHWTKAFGPDDVMVDPVTGTVTWIIPSGLPGESYHIGLRAANDDGAVIETWILNVGVPAVVYVGGAGDPDRTLVDAFANHTQAGTTFILRNGVYAGIDFSICRIMSNGAIQYPPQGTASKFTTVMAEDPGGVTLTGGAVIDIDAVYGDWGYAAFKGFFVKDGSITTIGYERGSSPTSGRPHHIKFIRNGVESAGDIPFNAFRSDDILFENNYAFGGGRYKFSTYHANRVVFRRNVARYDRANNEMAEPKGTYGIYSTMDAAVSNSLAVDADTAEFITTGELAGEFSCPVTSGNTRATFDRNMQLNSEMLYGNLDDQVSVAGGRSDAEIRDVVSWDVRPVNAHVMTRGGSWFDHVTFGDIAMSGSFAAQIFNGWPSHYARGMTNSLLHAVTNGNLFYGFTKQSGVSLLDRVVDRYGVDHVNITGTPGILDVDSSTIGTTTSIDPIYSSGNPTGGLRYLTRIEANSTLSGQALDGGDLGATVMTFKGRSGTFWGEPGYNSETGIPMWPFPFEEVIGAKMAAYSYTGTTYTGPSGARVATGSGTIIGTRGFAVPGQTLTNYVWNYIGNTTPPFNVSAIPGSGSVRLLWDMPAAKSLSTLTGFRIYDFDPATKTLSNPRSVGAVNEYVVTGLINDTGHMFAVTAVDSVSGEGGYSYPVQAMPTAGLPDTTAPVLSLIGVDALTATSATITWMTDEPADTQVEYGPTASYGSSTTLVVALSTVHGQALVGLSSSTVYNYRVKSRDAAGNLAISTDRTLTTPGSGGGTSGGGGGDESGGGCGTGVLGVLSCVAFAGLRWRRKYG
jgi:hypothetical protein